MTTTTRNQQVRPAPGEQWEYPEEEAGFGWMFFAGTVMGLAGFMRIIDSIWAFNYHGALPDNLKDSALGTDLKHYAWLWLGVGTLLIISSLLILAKSQFARWFGVVAAAVGGLSSMFWMPYYPIWSLVYIGLAVTTIYALIVYGGRTPGESL